ncbi:MAG: EamA family transporter [Micavibrio sp.]
MAAHLWFFYALGSAIIWGFSYALSEKVLKAGIQPSFLMVVTGVITLFGSIALCTSLGQFKSGLNLLSNDKSLLAVIFAVAVSYVVGNLLIYMAVAAKNATYASLIEISYPAFVALFAFLFYKEVQFSFYTAMGGLLIFTGVAIIYTKS